MPCGVYLFVYNTFIIIQEYPRHLFVFNQTGSNHIQTHGMVIVIYHFQGFMGSCRAAMIDYTPRIWFFPRTLMPGFSGTTNDENRVAGGS